MNDIYRRTALVLTTALLMGACGLLTVERIDSPPSEAVPGEATLQAIEGALERQGEILTDLATQVAAGATENARQDTILSYLATRGPAVPPSQEGPTASPPLIIGSVEIEDGKCCVGGTAGETIEIEVRFSAIGLKAPADSMRYRTGGFTGREGALEGVPWRPFDDEIKFSYTVPVNWTGFYIQVQYRDTLGNLSPVYSDDISVEGMPGTPEG